MSNIILITGCNGNLANKIISFLSKNYRIIGCDLHAADDERTLRSYELGMEKYFHCNLTNEESIKQLFIEIKQAGVFPNALINNAAIDFVPASGSTKVDGLATDNFDDIFKVNVKAPLLLAKLCIDYWIQNDVKGNIVNLSTIYSQVSPDPNLYQDGFIKNVLYGASKSALNSISKQLSVIYAKKGIRANTIVFAGVANPEQSREFVSKYSNRIPIGRLMDINEIEPAICFLLDEKNTYMTGSTIHIDGAYCSI